jgi:predicted nucleic acid-binding protein
MTLLLDTSAILLHFFQEPGGERVQELLSDDANEILIASVSVVEFARRLTALGYGVDEARSRGLEYASLAERVVPVDTATAVRAFDLSSLGARRIPLVDSLIAACASLSGAALVNRDAHFKAMSAEVLQRVDL